MDLCIGLAAPEDLRGRSKVARLNALYRRADNIGRPDCSGQCALTSRTRLRTRRYVDGTGYGSTGRWTGKRRDPLAWRRGYIGTQQEKDAPSILLLAEVNIGEQDLPRARELRVAQFVSDGSIVIDPRSEGRRPSVMTGGTWPNPSNCAPQIGN